MRGAARACLARAKCSRNRVILPAAGGSGAAEGCTAHERPCRTQPPGQPAHKERGAARPRRRGRVGTKRQGEGSVDAAPSSQHTQAAASRCVHCQHGGGGGNSAPPPGVGGVHGAPGLQSAQGAADCTAHTRSRQVGSESGAALVSQVQLGRSCSPGPEQRPRAHRCRAPTRRAPRPGGHASAPAPLEQRAGRRLC